jgi:cytochrome c-type biogenesis protein CcmF
VILIGELSLWVALLMATWSALVSFAGGSLRRGDLVVSGERASYAAFGFVALASLGLWTALLRSDFSLSYVAQYTSLNLPTVYKFSAFWGGQSGSMLFWCLILAMFGAIVVFNNRDRYRSLMPWVTGTMATTLVFFLVTTAVASNPFERLPFPPPDGRGLNPQLQNPAMAIHPPNLYLGYVATTVPFAFAIGALITRRLDAEWLGAVRRWALISWFFLTIGITLGMWWAYVELGWGGVWAWDPVENASLLPWLTGTAFLHSIMIQEKRGMLRKWNVTLVVATFLLSLLGTFITRSGVIQSVHSFARSGVGNWFLIALVAAFLVSAYLVATRLKDLETPAQLESMLSREAAFLYNNLVLVGIAFSVLWGTLFPILSEWIQGEKITVGAPFFNTVNIPLALLLLALTGIGPLIAWRRASPRNLQRQFTAPLFGAVAVGSVLLVAGMRDIYALVCYTLGGFVITTITQEFVKGIGARRIIHGESLPIAAMRLIARNRRRYGGYIVHFGVVIMFAALAGAAFKKDYDVRLRTGESFTARDPWGAEWTFTSQGVSYFEALNRIVVAAALRPTRNGEVMPVILSERRQHIDALRRPTFEPSTEVGILETARQDVYMVFAGATSVEGSDDPIAEIKLTFNPLMVWVWWGGIIMAIGGLIVMWPQAERARREGGYAAEMQPQPIGAEA